MCHMSAIRRRPLRWTETDPFEGEVTVGEELWDKIVQTLTFGLYSNTEVTVAGTAQDSLSRCGWNITYQRIPAPKQWKNWISGLYGV